MLLVFGHHILIQTEYNISETDLFLFLDKSERDPHTQLGRTQSVILTLHCTE